MATPDPSFNAPSYGSPLPPQAAAPYSPGAHPGPAPTAIASPAPWHRAVLYAVPVLALLALIATFLPVATVSAAGESQSANYWSDQVDAKGEAVLLLLLFLAAIGLGVASILRQSRPLLIVAGAVTAIAGLFGAIDGFGNLGEFSDDDLDLGGFIETNPGLGTYLLAFAGLFLVIGGVLLIIIGATTKPQAAAPAMVLGGYGLPGAGAPGQPGQPAQFGAPQTPYQQPGYGQQPPYQG